MGQAEPGARARQAFRDNRDLGVDDRAAEKVVHLVDGFSSPFVTAARRWRRRSGEETLQRRGVVCRATQRVGVKAAEAGGVGDQDLPRPGRGPVQQRTDETVETGAEILEHHQAARRIAGQKVRAMAAVWCTAGQEGGRRPLLDQPRIGEGVCRHGVETGGPCCLDDDGARRRAIANAVARRMRLRLFSSLSAVTSASDTEACHERDNAAAAHSVTRCCSCSRSDVILAI